MIAAMWNCQTQCLPGGPVRCGVFMPILMIVAVIFSIVMLIDCLKRKQGQFLNPLTKNGEYDKLIWAVGIVVSLYFYFVGAIVYYFAVKLAKPDKPEQSQPPQQ